MRRGNVDRGSKTPVSNDIPARFLLSTFRFRFLSFYRRETLRWKFGSSGERATIESWCHGRESRPQFRSLVHLSNCNLTTWIRKENHSSQDSIRQGSLGGKWQVATGSGEEGYNHSTKQESCESEVSAELPRYPLHRTFLFTGEERRMKEEWGGSIGTWRDESIFPVLPHFCVLD